MTAISDKPANLKLKPSNIRLLDLTHIKFVLDDFSNLMFSHFCKNSRYK